MGIIALIVLIGLGYWVIKIPYEILKVLLNLSCILLLYFVYYIKKKLWVN